MTMHTEAEIADLIQRFHTEAEAAPAMAPERPVTAPVTGYRVVVEGYSADVDADGYGAAVLAALTPLSFVLPDVRGHVFLWSYTVTDSYGVTLKGSDPDMRAMLEAARIARR